MKIKIAAARTSQNPGGIYAVAAVAAVTAMFAARSAVAVTQRASLIKAVRPPRVYNALITSDQQLLPSQADPIVSPVFLRPVPLVYGWPVAGSPYAGPYAIPYAVPSLRPPSPPGVATAASRVQDAVQTDDRGKDDDGGGGGHQPAVKNNRPADSEVPDVPPPPVPMAGDKNKDKKKPEEYPPAPVGFAI